MKKGKVLETHIGAIASNLRLEVASDIDFSTKEELDMAKKRQKQISALDKLCAYLMREQPQLKNPYNGAKEDGKASIFLKNNYGDDIDNGIINSADIRALDPVLYEALHKEVFNHNRTHPDNPIHLSDFLPTKQDVMRELIQTVKEAIPVNNEGFSELIKMMKSMSYAANTERYSR
jgi:hypothetical protein